MSYRQIEIVHAKIKNNYPETVIHSQRGDLAIMCPECFNYVFISGEFHYHYDTPRIANVMCRHEFSMYCDKCNTIYSNAIIIDPNIAHTIYMLNTKGYRTSACCEGHIYDDSKYPCPPDDPYIMFYKKYQFKDIPKYWEIDEDYTTTVIRCGYTDRFVGMKTLETWADNLPNLEEY